jgi:phosphate/sulfate permease
MLYTPDLPTAPIRVAMDFYLIAVIILFVVAIGDLVVGVSNDAVNFLNSAIGSQAAKRRTIMIVASLGVFVGAAFSEGIMEVARRGIFNPGAFTFEEIMIIFLAVMLTDIVLLDTFNTYGLPTSTTVSIVFELLGAATVVALLKMIDLGEAGSLATFINGSNALRIITSIFMSIGIAFVCGLVLQYLSRLLFTFQYERRLKTLGGIWIGLAMAAMSYFLFIKGLDDAAFIDKDSSVYQSIITNVPYVILALFAAWTLFAYALQAAGANVLRLIVLFGTFALALAFAGNDLVNFIGVPLAAFDSFNYWRESGMAASEFTMGILDNPVTANPWMLFGAGAVMAVTLWVSKKARTVTKTEVNLGRQDVGAERFQPGPVARGVVRGSRAFSGVTRAFLPDSFFRFTEPAFANPTTHDRADAPAFDLVRAAVNLAVASMLISFATAYKLPLSTTYVSFMVAMGTSLADRAWGRDSAVYRVSGVLTVVAGWFGTAIAASTAAGISAIILWYLDAWGLAILVVVAGVALVRTFTVHKRREETSAADEEVDPRLTSQDVHERILGRSVNVLGEVEAVYSEALAALGQEDRGALKKLRYRVDGLTRSNERLRLRLPQAFATIREEEAEGSRLAYEYYDATHDLLASATLIVYGAHNHVRNSMPTLTERQVADLQMVGEEVKALLREALEEIEGEPGASGARSASWLHRASRRMRSVDPSLPKPPPATASETDAPREREADFYEQLDAIFAEHVRIAKEANGNGSPRATELFVRLLTESRDLVAISSRYVHLFERYPANPWVEPQA